MAVGLDPVEPPVERPHDAVLADRMEPALPRVKEVRDHHVYTQYERMYFLLRLLITAAALWVAIQLVDGIDHRGSWWSLLLVALVFGVLNASVRPLLKLLSIPLLIVTLGLFIFVINALMLLLTAGCRRFSTSGSRSRVSGPRFSGASSSASSAWCCRSSRARASSKCRLRHVRSRS